MARINRAEVERVASLARLSLSDEEADRLAREFDSFIGYIDTLQEIDTTGVAPTARIGSANRWLHSMRLARFSASELGPCCMMT